MSLSVIYSRLFSSLDCTSLVAWSRATVLPPAKILRVHGAAGSLPAFLLAFILEEVRRPIVAILPEPDAAQNLYGDLVELASDPYVPLLFPPTGRCGGDPERLSNTAPLVQRSDVMTQLAAGFSGLVVTSIDALVEHVPLPSVAAQQITTLHTGDEIAPRQLILRLLEQDFERTDFVEASGELAWRGGIIDIYSYTGSYPIRLEFFGDEIESIREFDPRTQRSVSQRDSVRIVPNLQHIDPDGGVKFTSFFHYVPQNTLLAQFDSSLFAERVVSLNPSEDEPNEQRQPDNASLVATMARYCRISFGSFGERLADSTFSIESRPQPAFAGNLDRLRQHIRANAARGADTYVLCDSHAQKERLGDLLEDEVESYRLHVAVESLHHGFETVKLAVYTDYEIFGRHHRPAIRKRRILGGLRQDELRRLQPGDFVVHTDHGIGKFAGFHKITVRGKRQEALRILYAGDDVLYVNVNALHKLHKFKGQEGHQPRLTTLGSGQWERTKKRTKKRIKDIARDLIKLYSKRKATHGYEFSPDTVWQREMEAAFPFEDTPDQVNAAHAIKLDMEATAPMDRLVCGDVGFGKTEVAIRAAFKAAVDGKQVAVLVPTTVLARQHYETFKRRLASFPLRIEMLSRFRATKELSKSIRAMAEGTVDIAIGTHRLVSKDVRFKDLGLLIIDEEQRFGVRVKERLRQLRFNVDTLTLTATPIPRTLHFSLMGARDLSIISSPPPGRQAVATEIHTYDAKLIQDAILYEISRNGQVFFIHNRVKSIDKAAATLRELVPEARILVAHGQLRPTDLERIMMGFIDHKFEVLVCTTIIENGLDIANANTMIINQAQRFGLAELHQLRGRVGRSDRQAYCYLLVPSVHALTREARHRLQAVEELSDLGSGFHIAMRDLDIRGAGNMLGGEQSGFIAEVGFETYQTMLDEAVGELRSEEFEHLSVPARPRTETAVEVEEDAFIPESYVSNHLERLSLYRRITELQSKAALGELRDEILDRFGTLPPEVEHLICAAAIKLYAQRLRLPRVLCRNQRLFLQIPAADSDPLFFDTVYSPFLERLGSLEHRYVFKESKRGKLNVIVQNVCSLSDALSLLETLQTT